MGDLASHSDFQYVQAPFSSWDDFFSGAKAVADFLRENTAKILVQSAKDWICWKILEAHWDRDMRQHTQDRGSRDNILAMVIFFWGHRQV